MTAAERIVLKQKIEAAIIKTQQEVIDLEEATQPISPENSIGRLSRLDAINNKSVAEAGLRSIKRKLNNLQKALLKIEQPSFGLCAQCKRPIAPARLMYMPESTRCAR